MTSDGATRLLLARHGQTEHNRLGIAQGQTDVPLERRGIEQARALRDRLVNERIDAIYSSDLERAYRTATTVADGHGLAVTPVSTFRERSFGAFEGEPKHALREAAAAAGKRYSEWRPPEGETAADVADRAFPALEAIVRDASGETILVVAHGGVNRAIVCSILAGDCTNASRLSQENTCLNELRYDGGWSIRRLNDVAHLERIESLE